MKNTTKLLALLMVVVALVLTACANSAVATPQAVEPETISSQSIIAEGTLRPIHAVNLSFQARGVVEEIHVKIGDTVTKGEVLARLSNATIAGAQLSAANLELVNAQQTLDALNRNGSANLAAAWTAYMDAQIARADAERAWEDLNVEDIEDRIEDAEAGLKDLEENLNEAQDEFDKYEDLDAGNEKRNTAEEDLETTQEAFNEALRNLDQITRERDTIRAALDSALAAETEAAYQFEISADGVNTDQLALAMARLENATAQVSAADANLASYVLSAPFDGVIAEVNIQAGEQVGTDTRAVSVIDTSSWIVETTDVTELEVIDLGVGQKVTFTADALPDVDMHGVVTEISASSILQGGDVIYTVRIAAEDVDPRVRWGMTVEVIFELLADN